MHRIGSRKNGTARRGVTLLLAALMLVGSILWPAAEAQASLMILPIRIAFKPRDRMQILTVMNTGNKPATYKLSLFTQRQMEGGGYIPEKAPLDSRYDLSKMIVFSPREVHLPPNGSQAIRLSLRRPADMADGEYRVHLRLQQISGGEKQPPVRQPGGVTTQVTINVGFAIPVIVRHGKYDAGATISDFRFVPASADGKTPAKVDFYLNRTGKYSTLGRNLVFWTPPDGGKERQVGILNDVNVFSELKRRNVEIHLNDNTIKGGTFRVTYDGDDADKGIHFDEKTFPIK